MRRVPVRLVHGAATTSAVWSAVAAALPASWEVRCPDRAASGSLERELAVLAPMCRDAVVVGVSGGATLVVAMAMAGVPMQLAVAHEPAVGSLLPGLLAPVAAAYERGGVTEFATTLYGPSWTPAMAPGDPDAVARDLAMFRAFEPGPPAAQSRLTTTVGALSPPVRHAAAAALAERFAVPVRVVPGVAHAPHLEAPAAFASFVERVVSETGRPELRRQQL